MFKPLSMSILMTSVIAGCTAPEKAPVVPTMTQSEAMSYCRGRLDEISKPTTKVGLGIGIGSGGKVSTNTGISIGIDVSSDANKNKRYQSCVLEKSGKEADDSYI